MEFRKVTRKKEANPEEMIPDDSDLDETSSRVRPVSVGPRSEDSIVTDGQIGSVSIPGQAELQDLRAETPFAEWQVDAAAQGEANQLHRSATAWTLSQAQGGRSSEGEEILSQGPSAMTFLVAIVASVVMIGAFFSGGRQ